jgi:hypothetical protein
MSIDFEKEIEALYPREYVIPQKLVDWGRSIAKRVEEETIQRCQIPQWFNTRVSKIERLYAAKDVGNDCNGRALNRTIDCPMGRCPSCNKGSAGEKKA